MKETQRWKNINLWMAIAAFVPILCDSMDIVNFIPDNYDLLVQSILAIFVLAGIINNPNTESKWLKDD